MTRTPPIVPRVAGRPPARPPRGRRALVAGASAIAVALAFAGGRWTSDPAPVAKAGPVADAAVPADATEAPVASGVLAAPSPVPQVAPPAPSGGTSAPPPRRVSPEIVARVAAEASLGLERARADFVARCAPTMRIPGQTAPLTFNVTFDANGREIARGISEDRRHRAPEVASCLRRLPVGSLRVTPPGASVGVRVSMSLP